MLVILFFARFILKRKALLILLIFGLAAATWAQGWGRGWNQDGRNQPNRPQRPATEAVTVSGSLILAHGMPAVKSGDITYLVGRITRLTGFIDGLKEGVQVTVDGHAIASAQDSNLKYLHPTKLTLGGKSYDLTPPVSSFRQNNRQFSPPQGTPRQYGPPQGQGTPRQFGTPGPNRRPGPYTPQGRNHHQRQHMGPKNFRR